MDVKVSELIYQQGESFVTTEACKELTAKGFGIRESYKEIVPTGEIFFTNVKTTKHMKSKF